ncbi:MAG: hypothetical protein AAF293_11650 [Pseudomonadota bacterium]
MTIDLLLASATLNESPHAATHPDTIATAPITAKPRDRRTGVTQG